MGFNHLHTRTFKKISCFISKIQNGDMLTHDLNVSLLHFDPFKINNFSNMDTQKGVTMYKERFCVSKMQIWWLIKSSDSHFWPLTKMRFVPLRDMLDMVDQGAVKFSTKYYAPLVILALVHVLTRPKYKGNSHYFGENLFWP